MAILWPYLLHLTKFDNVKEHNNLGNPLIPFIAFAGHFRPFLSILISLIYRLT